jgi:carboxyl-terminal processing protease
VLGTQTLRQGLGADHPAAHQQHRDQADDGALLHPGGRSIQAKGITPDFLVEETPEGDITQFRVREADLSRHLSNDKDAEEKPRAPVPNASDADKLKDRKPIEFGSADDYQLQQGMNHLKGKPVAVAKAKEAPRAEAASGSSEKSR